MNEGEIPDISTSQPKTTPKHMRAKEDKLFESLSLKKATAVSIFNSRHSVAKQQ